MRRIRGVAHSMRVSPQSSNRMVDGARSVLNDFLADVYIFTDHMTGPEAGQSPGYGLMLVAETTTGSYISSECTANTRLKVGKGFMPFLLVSCKVCVQTQYASSGKGVQCSSKQIGIVADQAYQKHVQINISSSILNGVQLCTSDRLEIGCQHCSSLQGI